MKPFAKLTPGDLRTSPVWRYQSKDGDTLATVEADDRSHLSESGAEVFVASTTFRLADGSEFQGLCSPADPSGLDYLQPVILTEEGHVRLWSEETAGLSNAAAICQSLGRSSSEVFPLSFNCHVPVDESLVSGTITLSGALPNQALQLTVHLPPSGRSANRS